MLFDQKTESVLREKFEAELKSEVSVKVFSRSVIVSNENLEFAKFAENLVRELSGINGKIKAQFLSLSDDEAKKRNMSVSPTLLIEGEQGRCVEFTGAPLTYQAGVFIEAICAISRGVSGLGESDSNKLKNIDKEILLDVFVNSQSPSDVEMSLAACRIAVEGGSKIKTRILDVNQTVEIAHQLGISSSPCVVINGAGKNAHLGFLTEGKLTNLVLKYGSSKADEILASEEREAKEREKLSDNPDYPVILTDNNFDEAVKKYPFLVVDCWAEWCGPCRMIHPIVESLARRRKGEIVFGKLNVDENRNTAARFSIMSIPTLLVFKNGQNVGNIIGAMPEAMLEGKINAYREK